MSFLGYFLFRVFVIFIAILPFRIIYCISDLTYYFVYYIARYRRKVVSENLCSSFPNKTKEELKQIEKKFYHFLTDLIFESIKGMSMTKTQIKKRHRIANLDILELEYNKNQSVIGVTGHFGNWEWGAFSSGIQLKHKAIAFYKPLSNKYINGYMKRRRAKFRTTLASIYETNEIFIQNVPQCSVFIMAADQSPTNLKECFWVDFLNRETACLHGPEKYAKLFNLPVYYIDIQRESRGFYTLHLTLLVEKPAQLEPGKITELYMKTLESKIMERPEFWLWSHRRWKDTREGWEKV